MGIQITPSILNADFAALGAEVARIGSAAKSALRMLGVIWMPTGPAY